MRETQEAHAERLRVSRARWKAERLCTGCGREREDKAFSCCERCRAKAAKNARLSRALGVATPTKQRNKYRYHSLKAEGRCIRCAVKLEPGNKRVRCVPCNADMLAECERRRALGDDLAPEPEVSLERCPRCFLVLPHADCLRGSATRRREWV
jgi:hypothetical protein